MKKRRYATGITRHGWTNSTLLGQDWGDCALPRTLESLRTIVVSSNCRYRPPSRCCIDCRLHLLYVLVGKGLVHMGRLRRQKRCTIALLDLHPAIIAWRERRSWGSTHRLLAQAAHLCQLVDHLSGFLDLHHVLLLLSLSILVHFQFHLILLLNHTLWWFIIPACAKRLKLTFDYCIILLLSDCVIKSKRSAIRFLKLLNLACLRD